MPCGRPILALALPLLAAGACALDLQLEAPEPWLRAGLPVRWRMRAAPASDLRGPGQLEIAILRGDETLAQARYDLDDLGRLSAPWHGALFAMGGREGSAPALLQATLRLPSPLPGGLRVATASCRLGEPSRLRQRLEALPPGADAAARLRREMVEDLLSGLPRAADLDRAAALMDGAPAAPVGIELLPVAMPEDGSVQPAWLALPDAPRRLVVVLAAGGAEGKGRWRPLAGRPQPAGDGCAVLACYPGGDRDWRSLAPHRVRTVLAAALQLHPALAGKPTTFLASASASAAAQALAAAHAGTWGRLDDGPAAPWPAGSPPGADAALPRLPPYAERRFVVVVGTGEHQHARTANASLADAFLSSWGSIAHGQPPAVTDREFIASRWPGYHRVLIGNPRSNQVLARMVDDGLGLTASWDHRLVRFAGRSWLRADRPCLVLTPAGHACTILDGGPAWQPAELPLIGQEEQCIRAAPASP